VLLICCLCIVIIFPAYAHAGLLKCGVVLLYFMSSVPSYSLREGIVSFCKLLMHTIFAQKKSAFLPLNAYSDILFFALTFIFRFIATVQLFSNSQDRGGCVTRLVCKALGLCCVSQYLFLSLYFMYRTLFVRVLGMRVFILQLLIRVQLVSLSIMHILFWESAIFHAHAWTLLCTSKLFIDIPVAVALPCSTRLISSLSCHIHILVSPY